MGSVLIDIYDTDEESDNQIDDLELEPDHESLVRMKALLEIEEILDKMKALFQLKTLAEYRLARDIEALGTVLFPGKSKFPKNIEIYKQELDTYEKKLDSLRQQLENIPFYEDILSYTRIYNLSIEQAIENIRKDSDKIEKEEIKKEQENEEKILMFSFKSLIYSIQLLNNGGIYQHVTNREELFELIKKLNLGGKYKHVKTKEEFIELQKSEEIKQFINVIRKLYHVFMNNFEDKNNKTLCEHYIEHLQNIVHENIEHKETHMELCDIISSILKSELELHNVYLDTFDLENEAYRLFCSYNTHIKDNDELMRLWNELSIQDKIEWISTVKDTFLNK